MLLNRAIALSKRILAHTTYVIMLLSIVVLTIVYKCLPARQQSTNIVVAMYYEDDSSYNDCLQQYLDTSNSIYTFKAVDSYDELLDEIKSGDVECGFFVPEGFYEDYINGRRNENPIIVYTTPETTLSSPISESVFSGILSVTAADILNLAVGIPEFNDELAEFMNQYLVSEEIFKLESTVTGSYNHLTDKHTINLPVYELALIYIVFAALLGLLLFLRDKERNMYIALASIDQLSIKLMTIASAIVPVFIVSFCSVAFVYGFAKEIIFICLLSIIAFVVSFLLSFIIRKSTLLLKVLPLIAFMTTIIVFANSII